jgi:hypothetical protein
VPFIGEGDVHRQALEKQVQLGPGQGAGLHLQSLARET